MLNDKAAKKSHIDISFEFLVNYIANLNHRDLEEELNSCIEALKVNKKDCKTNMYLAAIYYLKEDYLKANIHSYISLLSEPNNKIALMVKFLSLFKLKKFKEAQEISYKLDENDELIKGISEVIDKEVNKLIYTESLMPMLLDNKAGEFELDSKYEYENKKLKLIHDKEKGMKVVAKQELFKGEIVCISKPIVVYKVPKEQPKFQIAQTNPTKELFNKLQTILKGDNNKLKEHFLSLYDGSNQEYSLEERKNDIDYSDEKILLVLTHNQMSPLFPSYFNTIVSKGLWYLPSFFNHSCVPNVIYFGIGDCMILIAVSTIKKGEELTISYESIGKSYLNRCLDLQTKYGFTCRCPLCLDERKRLVQQNTIQKKLFDYLQMFEDKNLRNNISIKDVDSMKAFVTEYEDNFNWYELSAIYFFMGDHYGLINSSLAYSMYEKSLENAIEGNDFLMSALVQNCLNTNRIKEKNKKEMKAMQKRTEQLYDKVFLYKQFSSLIRVIDVVSIKNISSSTNYTMTASYTYRTKIVYKNFK